jgi:hypothetical protein
MSGLAVPAIETLRVAGIQVLHSSCEIRLRGADQKVVMGRHEAEAVTDPILSRDHIGEQIQKSAAVLVVAKERLARHSARGNVEGSAWNLKPRLPWHESTVERRQSRNSARASLATKLHLFCRGV